MSLIRFSGSTPATFKADWVDHKGELAPHAHGANHHSCACAPHSLIEPHPAAHSAAAEAHAVMVRSPEVMRAGVAAALGYNFDYDAMAAAIKESLGKYVGADTTNPPGNEGRVIDIVADELAKAGIKPTVTEFAPGRKNLIATLKGNGSKKPLILIAHTDVVPTDGQIWSVPPHQLSEKDGMLWGRGTRDDLCMVAANVRVFIELSKSKVPLDRDIILVLEGDEEFHSAGAVDLLKTAPELANAGLVINEGGYVLNAGNGTPATFLAYEAAQKTAQDFILTTKGQPGHSAFPVPGNAIARIGKALGKIGDAKRPARVIDVVREYFKKLAPLTANDKLRNAMIAVANAQGDPPADAVAVLDSQQNLQPLLRTTFAPTLVSGGTKNNVLPAGATANINARIMPDESIDDAEKWLAGVIDDKDVVITRGPANGSAPASALEGEFVDALKVAAASIWPAAPLLPSFAAGYTDSRFFRALGIPSYGFNPFPGTSAELLTMHAGDERIQAAGLRPGVELYTKLVLQLAAQPATKR
jgi:acetylornithine deacetylase/succinyl-diaminopimelate desuccinylase-like protein